MRIEQVDKIKLSKACDKELLILKLRFTQLWDKVFVHDETASVGSLNRNKFLKNYKMLLDEMDTRKIEKSTSAIDKAVFKKAMTTHKYGIDVSDFEDIVLFPNVAFVSAGSINNETVNAILKQRQDEVIEFMKTNDANKPVNAYIPIYDLVLKAKQKTEIIEVSKPYPNEHSARLQSPDKFDTKTFRRTKGGTLYGSKKIPSTVSIIWGKLKDKAKPTDPPIAQALRFPTSNWTATKAKKWLADNEIKFTTFEAATKKTKKLWSKKYIDALPDSAFMYVDAITKTGEFPYINREGKIDLIRLTELPAKITKSDLSEDIKTELIAKAEKLLEDIKEGKTFEKFVSVYPIDKADKEEHIVCGVVYTPDEEDSQGDKANAEEIRKAAYQFMEQVQTFKVMHKGNKVKVKVLESYVAPAAFTIAKQAVKKGTWLITVRVLDKAIWKAVKDGELTGFSMAGYANTA